MSQYSVHTFLGLGVISSSPRNPSYVRLTTQGEERRKRRSGPTEHTQRVHSLCFETISSPTSLLPYKLWRLCLWLAATSSSRLSWIIVQHLHHSLTVFWLHRRQPFTPDIPLYRQWNRLHKTNRSVTEPSVSCGKSMNCSIQSFALSRRPAECVTTLLRADALFGSLFPCLGESGDCRQWISSQSRYPFILDAPCKQHSYLLGFRLQPPLPFNPKCPTYTTPHKLFSSEVQDVHR